MEENKEKIRCFIAIDLPRESIKEIERVQEEVRKKNIFTGRFTEGENLHLTLKFLGEIDFKMIEKVKKRLTGIEMKSFEACLGELGVFSPNFIKIIWVKIFGSGVFELQKKIDGALFGLFRSERRFMSHLTIARVKSVKDRKLFLEKLEEVSVSKMKFPVREFYLMKSELKPEGPVYGVIEKYRLGV